MQNISSSTWIFVNCTAEFADAYSQLSKCFCHFIVTFFSVKVSAWFLTRWIKSGFITPLVSTTFQEVSNFLSKAHNSLQ